MNAWSETAYGTPRGPGAPSLPALRRASRPAFRPVLRPVLRPASRASSGGAR